MIRIAFDVDGTLIYSEGQEHPADTPRYEVIALFKSLYLCKDVQLYIWSGGGIDYALHWAEKLGLDEYIDDVIEKTAMPNDIDICFDDENVKLGKVNIRI